MKSVDQEYVRISLARPALAIAIGIVLVSLFTCSAVANGIADRKVLDLGAVMPDSSSNDAHATQQLVFKNPNPFEFVVLLPSLTNHERKKIEEVSIPGPEKIGIHREVP